MEHANDNDQPTSGTATILPFFGYRTEHYQAMSPHLFVREKAGLTARHTCSEDLCKTFARANRRHCDETHLALPLLTTPVLLLLLCALSERRCYHTGIVTCAVSEDVLWSMAYLPFSLVLPSGYCTHSYARKRVDLRNDRRCDVRLPRCQDVARVTHMP